MEIPVLIEPEDGTGYRASGLGLSTEAATSEAARERLQEQIRGRFKRGVRIVSLNAPSAENPWLKFAGGLKGHPLLEQWGQAMSEYRRVIDSEPIDP
jgi:hypothetical protein